MYLFGVLIAAAVLTTIKAEVDCHPQPPPHVNFSKCCELANLISEEVKEKCVSRENHFKHFEHQRNHSFGPHAHHHHGPNGIRGGPHPKAHCFLSCVVNEAGIIVDGEIQEDNLISYLNKIHEDEEKVEFLKNKFILCNEKRQVFKSKLSGYRHGPPHCMSERYGILMACVHVEAFNDCLDAFWLDTNECNEARDHLKQCSTPNENQNKEDNI